MTIFIGFYSDAASRQLKRGPRKLNSAAP